MKSIATWFTKNPVAANLLMLLLVVGGLAASRRIEMELFPEFSLDMIRVSVAYPGAAPEEIEESICIPIEEEVHAIEGVRHVHSTAVENLGSVLIEVRSGADVRRVLDDVKTRVDAIDSFPEEAESPVIEEQLMRTQVINVAVFGDVDEHLLKRLGEQVRDEITALEGISQVELASVRPYEVSIEVSEATLRRYGLELADVAQAVRSSSLDLSGGSIKTAGGEVLLRTKGQAYVGEDFEEAVVRTLPDGSRVLVRDVATVVDGFEDTDQAARFNGEPAALVQVFRIGDESALELSASVHDYVAQKRARLPAGVSIETWQDGAAWLKSRLELLLRNGLQGLLLVFLVLALFLQFRLSFWVTLGIPVSFLGTLLVMPWLGVSVNMLSLFAFILVLGIVVDDAIVVGESIFNEGERGKGGREAAVSGVTRVAVPVIFAVLTTIAAFVPMAVLPGMMGKFFGVIPLVVIPALLFSLVESQWILPAHLAHSSRVVTLLSERAPFRWWALLRGRFAGGMDFVRLHVYRPLLGTALRWRYVTLAVAIAIMLMTLGFLAGGFLKFIYFPEVEGDVVAVQITMPQGTSAETTERAVRRIEAAALRLRDQLEREEPGVIVNMMGSVGEQPYMTQKTSRNGRGAIVGAHYGEVVIELTPAENRDISSTEITGRWRELTGSITGAVEVNFDSSLMSAGKPIDVQFSGPDVESLRAAADELKIALSNYAGVFDVTDSFRGGKEEWAFDILPSAEALGLTRRDLATQVRQGFHGEEAQRFQRGRDEVKVMVRYPERDRRTLYGLETMRVRGPGGVEVPFASVASADVRRGYATIQRTDRRRTVDVVADVDTSVSNANEVLADLADKVMPGILAAHPGVNYTYEGQSSEQADTTESLKRNFALALLAIFGLMAIPFRSYLQPVIVMTAIPFGIVGAVLGHAVMGIDLSMLSVLGIVALSGVVVNDSLVMVEFVNRERAEGRSPREAARQAGLVRFRPILLTSLTTFAGLTPLLLERSVQAQFLIPMAVSLAFGVMFATLISLILVPACYVILEDLTHIVGRAARFLAPSLVGPADPVD